MRTPGFEPWEPVYTDRHSGEEITDFEHRTFDGRSAESARARLGEVPDDDAPRELGERDGRWPVSPLDRKG